MSKEKYVIAKGMVQETAEHLDAHLHEQFGDYLSVTDESTEEQKRLLEKDTYSLSLDYPSAELQEMRLCTKFYLLGVYDHHRKWVDDFRGEAEQS